MHNYLLYAIAKGKVLVDNEEVDNEEESEEDREDEPSKSLQLMHNFI